MAIEVADKQKIEYAGCIRKIIFNGKVLFHANNINKSILNPNFSLFSQIADILVQPNVSLGVAKMTPLIGQLMQT